MIVALTLLVLLLIVLVCSIIERNIERGKCAKYLSEIFDHDPGAD